MQVAPLSYFQRVSMADTTTCGFPRGRYILNDGDGSVEVRTSAIVTNAICFVRRFIVTGSLEIFKT
jgi:hypothetical protein